MKKVFLLLIAVVIFSSGCIQKSDLEGREWKSDVTPALGAGKNPLGTNEDGPWNHRLLIAISKDGISWQKLNIILADQASVPDILVDSEGYVRIYYVDFYNGGIVVAISKDLKNWENPVEVLKGEENSLDKYGAVNPAVAELPNGNYLMVYRTWIEEPVFMKRETEE